MPYYLCRIAGEDGRVESRSVLATAADECRRTFEAEGLLVLSVHRDWNRLGNLGFRLGRKVKDRDIILFNQELVAMIKAGYPILKSLESISARIKNVHLREILIDVAGEVKKGKALSEAFQPYEKLFSPGLYGQPDGRRKGRQPGRRRSVVISSTPRWSARRGPGSSRP